MSDTSSPETAWVTMSKGSSPQEVLDLCSDGDATPTERQTKRHRKADFERQVEPLSREKECHNKPTSAFLKGVKNLSRPGCLPVLFSLLILTAKGPQYSYFGLPKGLCEVAIEQALDALRDSAC